MVFYSTLESTEVHVHNMTFEVSVDLSLYGHVLIESFRDVHILGYNDYSVVVTNCPLVSSILVREACCC